MSEQLQLRSGTYSQVAAFKGASAECVVDTTNNRLVVQDNATTGGWAAAKLTEVVTNIRAAVSDANYTVAPASPTNNPVYPTLVAYTALTASRAVTLPAAASFPTGTRLTIVDETGLCSPMLSISVVAGNTTDTINGANSTAQATWPIAAPYGLLALESNGVGAWTITDGAASSTVLAESAHGSQMVAHILEIAVTLPTSGTSYSVPTQIPANCIVLGCSLRVNSAVTGPTSLEVGYTGSGSNQFGTVGVNAGTTNYGILGNPQGIYSATTITITTVGGSFSGTAGTLRLALHYLMIAYPMS
jgi:hypothetical protein